MESFDLLLAPRLQFTAYWLSLALVNAGIAQAKFRRGSIWFVLSLLGGPLVTLVLLLLPRVRQRTF